MQNYEHAQIHFKPKNTVLVTVVYTHTLLTGNNSLESQ